MILIFDCDGVVLDSMTLHTAVEAEAYGGIGIKVAPEELVRRFSGVPQDEVSRILQEETGVKIPPDMNDRIEKTKERVFADRLQPIPGIHEVLKALDDLPRCIASGTGLSGLTHMLGVTGLYDHFAPRIYSSEMVVRGKPFPDIFLYAAEQMNRRPEDCLVIEDGSAGVQAAVSAGMRVFGFCGGSHCTADHAVRLMEAGAEVVFDHMSELPGLIGERAQS